MKLVSYLARERITQTDLARELGVPPSTVHGWVSGRRRPSYQMAEALRRATRGEVRMEDFVEEQEP